MKQYKLIILITVLVLVVSFTIPTLLVLPYSSGKASGKLDDNVKKPKSNIVTPSIEVSVYRDQSQKVETLPLEEYVVGVVASEMNADFEEEALKAQALAARTFIIRHLLLGGNSDLPEGANITDTISDQVFKNKTELKKQWGDEYNWRLKKITDAVKATSGEILTYNGTPIDAVFFSTSNGFTENSEEYWSSAIPYLKSVESPWDKKSPKFQSQKTISVTDFESQLGVKLNGTDIGAITSLTKGKRVSTVMIGGKQFTGREVRSKLNLRSSDFQWIRKGDNIIITTKGYGHGVGMSQYGANGMAEKGMNYKEIVKHYYQGVQIDSTKPFLEKVTAKK
ncbi:stage II sporulation protein D [Heyndrickxia oleronia]|jgi:stage II sporulation protein D|uniref:Stage II sporulation protein D n=1 Tax=Heyndrickxia oleronia TaxID=38875 RepID=A0AAW6T3I8_9BACI|nr:stage II sporulation protein D [Heyndrickxia oleronia]MCI1589299.1 stage II sporulation protein D [Heyndrickxia oleronia]MCI1612410.1 stage II sporulation protein D [Heyndrickxia oleronia]MCI1743628.1 stage II sporulation protein D [Heyndrickxia oleronia]MCI1760335.1 stage II sporulation protein D [Heyndrickxia oleronia]MDH5162801.1 stage II sporulation protein D [Heyndrickxia oleronia]